MVHSGAGNHTGTLVNRLVHHFKGLSKLEATCAPALSIAWTRILAESCWWRAPMQRTAPSGTVRFAKSGKGLSGAGTGKRPNGDGTHRKAHFPRRHSSDAHDHQNPAGRQAITTFRVLERFEKYTLLEVRIGTGRTHQIRVHLSSFGYPVAGDRLYGARPAERMFLHAWRIRFVTPAREIALR